MTNSIKINIFLAAGRMINSLFIILHTWLDIIPLLVSVIA